ncbi:teichoic acid translocation permease protein TagG [Abditibacteriota bacterium]|nr:teichoic acid translocation permease protein TagG [Abditibacteriota bacterium]
MISSFNSVNAGFSVRGGERDSIVGSVLEIWRFRGLVLELVRRDLKVRYKNRVGGVLWSLFPPLMQVLTIWLMVKFFFAQISDYSSHLMAVMFLWQFFQNTVLDASQAMIVNAPLARKIYFPRAVLPLVTLISNLLHFGVAFLFTLVYFFVMPLGHPTYPGGIPPFFWMAPFCVLGLGMFALGIGYLLAYLTTLYDDVKFLSVTLLGLFFYLVPVLYPIERVFGQAKIYPFYMLNPAAVWLVGFQRSLLPPLKGFPTVYHLPFDWLAIAFVVSFATLVGGFWIFERSKWTMMERL